MILRRLSESLKEQNWTAIGIEFVLLVVGVYLGIQVANWNTERGTNKKSVEMTEKLIADLREESWRYQLLLEYHRDVRDAAEKAAAALSGWHSAVVERSISGECLPRESVQAGRGSPLHL